MKPSILRATKSVYAYYLPETRKVISEVVSKYPHELFLKSIFPGLDNFQVPVIKKFIKKSTYLKGLNQYKYQYPINGSSEAIFHLFAWIKANHSNPNVYIVEGEYEGYKAYADALKINITVVKTFEEMTAKPKGFIFLSNPSAVNGNIIKNGIVKILCDAGHKIIYDGAYFNTTSVYNYDLKHPNIIAVLCSFSKPFGIFYHRIGFMFSRIQIESLYGNIWFKNMLSLIIIDKLIDKFKPGYIYKKYSKFQKKAIELIYQETGLSIMPSDCFLLAYTKEDISAKLSKKIQKLIRTYKRGGFYRFSLTPYFLEIEK